MGLKAWCDLKAKFQQFSVQLGMRAEEEGAIMQDALMVVDIHSDGAIDAGGGTTQCIVDGIADEYSFEVDDMVSVYWNAGANVIHGWISEMNPIAATDPYAVTIDSYSGNFPAGETAVTIVQQTEIAAEFDGDNLAALAASCSEAASLNFVDGTTLQLATLELTAGLPWSWIEGMGYTNPFAGKTVDKIGFVQYNPAGTELCKLALLHDNVT